MPQRKPEQAQHTARPAAPQCRASLGPPAQLGVQSEAGAWGSRPPGSAPLTHTQACGCPSSPRVRTACGSPALGGAQSPGVPASETGKDAVLSESKLRLLRSAGGELDGVSLGRARPAQGWSPARVSPRTVALSPPGLQETELFTSLQPNCTCHVVFHCGKRRSSK